MLSLHCSAQEPVKDKISYFKVAANYLSNAVYSGRKDSSIVPYFRPSLGYYNKSGFFASAGMSVLVSPSEPLQVDLITTEVGYEFSLSEHVSGGLSASKFFYSDASFASTSELKGAVGVNLTYDLPVITFGTGAELLFSTNTDINANINVSHSFGLDENKQLQVTPTFQVNAGTQYFNQAYYEFRKFSVPTSGGSGGSSGNGSNRGKGHSHGSGSSTTTVQTITFTNQNKFSILDYEISLPVTYDLSKWGIFLIPYYVLPTSAANYVINGQLKKEQLTNTFFIELGAYLKLHK